MGRVLFLSGGARGVMNALAAVQARVRGMGHEVDWARFDHEPAREPDEANRGRLLRDRRAYRTWLRARLLEPVDSLLDAARTRVRLFAPDLVVTPSDFYPGVLAAVTEGRPFIGVTSSLGIARWPGLASEQLAAVEALAEERAARFARWRAPMPFAGPHALSPQGTLLFAAPQLLGPAPLPAGVHAVGPVVASGTRGDEPWFPRWRLRDKPPLLVVSFGKRFAWQPELLTVVARAAAPSGGQLVIAAGALAETTFPLTLSGDVLAVADIPQLELLARADVLVTQGGAASVMEASALGVPMLVLPLGEDHPAQARAVEAAGVGIAVEPGTLAEAGVRTALLALVDERGPYRRRAADLAARARAADGARTAAQTIAARLPVAGAS